MQKIVIIDLDNSAHPVTNSGKLFVYGAMTVPPTILHDAAKVTDYRDGLKRPQAIRNRLRAIGLHIETVVADGGYALIAFHDAQERRVCAAAAGGIKNLRANFVANGGSLEDLDACLARSAV